MPTTGFKSKHAWPFISAEEKKHYMVNTESTALHHDIKHDRSDLMTCKSLIHISLTLDLAFLKMFNPLHDVNPHPFCYSSVVIFLD